MPPYNLKDTYFSLKKIISGVLGGGMELGFLDFLQDFILQIYTATIFKEATHHINPYSRPNLPSHSGRRFHNQQEHEIWEI